VDVAPSRAARTRPRSRLALDLVVVAAVLGRVAPAAAEAERVVLAGMPENLADATDTVLVPWQIEMLRVTESPAADPDQARRDAEALATRTRAGAVLWLAAPPESPTLWMYDASSRQVLSRPLPSAPPYDDPTAASVALSIKTLLRHSSVAPPAERVTPKAVSPQGPPQGPPPVPPVPRPAPPRPFTIDARAALRLAQVDTAWGYEPRLGVGVTWWPAFVPGRPGLGLAVDLGPGQPVARGGFRGRFHDLATTLALRSDIALPLWGERVSLVPMLGVGVHVTRVAGEQQPQSAQVRVSRLVPSIAAGVDAYARIGRIVRIGVTLQGALMTRTQDYESMERTIAGAPPFMVSTGIALLVSL
jgi:hypothetical protein